jgi:hypothetical protein
MEEGALDQLSQVLCCGSSGQVRKRADGGRTCDANIWVSSEYLIGSDHSTAAIQVCPLRSRAVVKLERSH